MLIAIANFRINLKRLQMIRDFDSAATFPVSMKHLGIKVSFTRIDYDRLQLIKLTIMTLFISQFISSPDASSKFEIKFCKLSKISDMVRISYYE